VGTALKTPLLRCGGDLFHDHELDYNALDSGEDTAKGLGINVERVRDDRYVRLFPDYRYGGVFPGIIGFFGLVGPRS
jgi:iron complex transport system permease protein